ncbi:MAG: precorrin-8X methylmutase [Lachnospiraceae bacterium]|jgi:precorrin-8X/cobalt-precorrin-8 methylmutase|nr:precorrin-8X methylmutase [Lachnospiraceae bacterium]
MEKQLAWISPEKIESRSMEIIEQEMLPGDWTPGELAVVKRCIHTSADFDYASNLYFSPDAVDRGKKALGRGAVIVTDTAMAAAGINKAALEKLGCSVRCFMGEEDVAREARERGITRAIVSMERAAALEGTVIFAVGNAPTALIRLCELIQEEAVCPALIIGVPVGFVNVVESKERLCAMEVPCIVARGRKGGSNIAAAICNALLYQLVR